MRKIVIVVPLVAALLFFVGAAPVRAAALTDIQIQALITLLTSFGVDASTIANVNATLRGTAPGACPSLTYTLNVGSVDGSTGGQVSLLQQFLGIGPTGYFGPVTQKAVQEWQSGRGIAAPGVSGYGIVGPKTRAAIGCIGGVSAPSPVAPTATSTTPYPAPVFPGTVDQSGTTLAGAFTLSGVASTTTVTVYVVPASYTGAPDLPSLASFAKPGTSRTASATATVFNGRWSAYFALDGRGFPFPDGSYKVYVFGQSLIGYGTFMVAGSTNPLLTCSLSARHDAYPVTATLSWTSNNASYAVRTIESGNGSTTAEVAHLPAVGTTTVSATPGTTYMYTFYGKGTSTSCKVTL
jgi:peptidoglycan hydrolase-like protein with peptidoglycan-binding domain